MSITIDQFDEWMNAPKEDRWLEFKEAKNQFPTEKVMRYCVAIANEGGGKLILGVTDQVPRKIVGTRAFDSIQDIQSKIFEKLRFRVDVEEIQAHANRIVIFHIPSRAKADPVHMDGAYLMRIGEETHPMSPDQLRKIFAEGEPDWFSEIALASINDEDVSQLLDINAYFRLTKQALPSVETVLERFEQERLIMRSNDRFSITNLGAILFAKDLGVFQDVERKAARVIVYEGRDKTANTKADMVGKKGYAVGFEGLIGFIGSYLPKNEVIGKALRETVQMYPDIAIRELVANAIIHQDFGETGTSVLVEIYTDRIEVSNPGTPFIPPERFIDEFQSRNERLAALMRRLRICEEKGSGIDKVIQSVEVFQLPAPDFRAGERRTLAILFGHKELDEMDSSDKIRACYQHCVLKWVMEERMTNQSLRERFKLPESKADLISRIIHDTVEAHLVRLANPESTSRRYTQYVPFWA